MDLYARLLAPLAWRIPGQVARMLHRFAQAELASMMLGPVMADTEHLFERLDELRFLAFLHLGESRARRQRSSRRGISASSSGAAGS